MAKESSLFKTDIRQKSNILKKLTVGFFYTHILLRVEQYNNVFIFCSNIVKLIKIMMKRKFERLIFHIS
jgi:translation initiation factor 2 beta subunit (eIF-2beta)/eIF-5